MRQGSLSRNDGVQRLGADDNWTTYRITQPGSAYLIILLNHLLVKCNYLFFYFVGTQRHLIYSRDYRFSCYLFSLLIPPEELAAYLVLFSLY